MEIPDIETIKQLLSLFGATPGVEQLITSVLGGNAAGLGLLSYQNNKTLETNIRRTQRAADLRSMFEATNNRIAASAVERASAGFYRLLGYDSAAAASAAADGSMLQSVLGTFLVAPDVRESSAAIGGALYDQRGLWDATYPTMSRSGSNIDPMYIRNGRWLLESVLTDATAGKFSGMNLKDTGSLAAAMIRAGRYSGYVDPLEYGKIDIFNLDAAAEKHRAGDIRDATDVATGQTYMRGEDDTEGLAKGRSLLQQQARINRFKRELNDYASAVNSLRDVIEGPFERVMESFEMLTGNKLVTMSAGRAGMTASAIRATLQNGGLDEQALRNLAAKQYMLVAPLGVDQNMAAQLSLVTTAGLASGVGIEGVSDIEYGEGQARLNTRNMLNGNIRNVAAAYAHWQLKNNRQANADSFAAFSLEMTKSGSDFITGSRQYLDTNNVSAELYRSSLVTSNMRIPQLIAEVNAAAVVPEFNKIVDQMVSDMGLNTDAQAKIRGIVRQTRDPAELLRRLAANGMTEDQAAAFVNRMEYAAVGVTQESDPLLALNIIQRAEAARNTLIESQAAGIWSGIRGQSMGSGLSGVIQALDAASGGGGSIGTGTLIQAAFGLDPNRVNDLFTNNAGSADRAALLKAEIARSTGLSTDDVDAMFTSATKIGSVGTDVLTARGRLDADPKLVAKRRLQIMRAIEKGTLTSKGLNELLHIDGEEDAIHFSERQKSRMLLLSKIRGVGDGQNVDTISEKDVDAFIKQQEIVEAEFKDKLDADKVSSLAYIRMALKNQLDTAETAALSSGKRMTEAQRIEHVKKQGRLLDQYYAAAGIEGDEARKKTADELAASLGRRSGLEAIVEAILELLQNWKNESQQQAPQPNKS